MTENVTIHDLMAWQEDRRHEIAERAAAAGEGAEPTEAVLKVRRAAAERAVKAAQEAEYEKAVEAEMNRLQKEQEEDADG